ncbi:MAG TPA: M1 family aminopeptidase, partial [Polyangiaceae bacterium]|nr:M1 family aminopeptidase [Polyangiaceae bacterium]
MARRTRGGSGVGVSLPVASLVSVVALVSAMALACSSTEDPRPSSGNPDAGDRTPPFDAGRPTSLAPAPGDILDTTLDIDLATQHGVATLKLMPSSELQSFEVGDLEIQSIHVAGVPIEGTRRGAFLDLGLPASDAPVDVSVEYDWVTHNGADGASIDGFSYLWPYWCGNAFPCRSAPAEGTTFHLAVRSPSSDTALYPTEIANDAPSYMLAWSVAPYIRRSLGTTSAGTNVSVWHIPQTESFADPELLVAAFDWMEQTIGPYRFGSDVGSVVAPWGGASGEGGIETHPYWQIGRADWDDEGTHLHEAAHGWFGNGVRLECWEDFVLSEGTASYLAARGLQEAGEPAES